MDVSRQELEQRYAEINDRALLDRYSSGTLTELAASVARAELVRRGIPLPEPEPEPEPEPHETAPIGRPLSTAAGALVAVTTQLNWQEANILRSLLASEGIPAELADAHLATGHPFLSAATGGVRMLVHERNVVRVGEVITALKRGDYALDDDSTEASAKR